MLIERGLETFEKALVSLDDKLDIISKKITVRAIGGFVMLYNGVTDHGYTIDIDSLTVEYDQDVKQLIKDVGRELDIDEDWLNNDCASLEGFLDDLATDINWIKPEYSFKNIEFYIADYIGMVKSKSKAIHDGGLVPRKTDKKDLLLLLKMENINTIEDINQDSRFKFIKEEYERTYDFLNDMKRW